MISRLPGMIFKPIGSKVKLRQLENSFLSGVKSYMMVGHVLIDPVFTASDVKYTGVCTS